MKKLILAVNLFQILQLERPFLNSPNEAIFEEYGSLTDPDSVISKSQYLLLRHGISDFNIAHKKIKQEIQNKYPDDPEQRVKEEIKEFSNLDKNGYLLDA